MKKNIQLLLFLLIAGFCLAGCGDDVEEITSDPVPVLDPDGAMKRTIHKFLSCSCFRSRWRNEKDNP